METERLHRLSIVS